MIAGGEGDDATFALLRRQLQDRVERAAGLECAGALQVFGFEAKSCAGQAAQRRRIEKRCAVNVRFDAHGGRPDVVDRHVGSFHALVGGPRLASRRGNLQSAGYLLQHAHLLLAALARMRPSVT